MYVRKDFAFLAASEGRRDHSSASLGKDIPLGKWQDVNYSHWHWQRQHIQNEDTHSPKETATGNKGGLYIPTEKVSAMLK